MNMHITEIRALLERYYSGEASQAETNRLCELMDAAIDLPADLAADRMMLRAVQQARPEMPDGLMSRLSAALDHAAKQRIHRMAPRTWMRIAGATAACIAAVALILRLHTSVPAPDAAIAELAEAQTPATETLVETMSYEDLEPAEQPKEEPATQPPAKKPQQKPSARIITDPDEILQLAQITMDEVEAGMVQTDKLLAEAMNCIEESQNNINAIIQ